MVRSKKNLQYKCIKWSRRLPQNILSDAEIELTGYYPHQYYPESLRLGQYWDEEFCRGLFLGKVYLLSRKKCIINLEFHNALFFYDKE